MIHVSDAVIVRIATDKGHFLNWRKRKMDRVKMPEVDEIKSLLESRYKIQLFGRVIDGQCILTQWSPIFIEVSWAQECAQRYEGYNLMIAENDHTKPMYATGYSEKETIDTVIARLGGVCKKRTIEQATLF
jgi:hypothetical protein